MRQFASRREPKPLDSARLEGLALAYAARFATSSAKLEAYLKRKLRERGWAGELDPPVQRLVEKFVTAGFVDDAAYARMKTGGLLRRGFGRRRIDQALGAAGISDELRSATIGDGAAHREAALVLARRKAFGPFSRAPLDRPRREKQIAAILRAGHSLDTARRIVEAESEAALEQWAEAGEE